MSKKKHDDFDSGEAADALLSLCEGEDDIRELLVRMLEDVYDTKKSVQQEIDFLESVLDSDDMDPSAIMSGVADRLQEVVYELDCVMEAALP